MKMNIFEKKHLPGMTRLRQGFAWLTVGSLLLLSSACGQMPESEEATVPPETTVCEATIPAVVTPETTIPETTIPETTVPETTVPETRVPETEAPVEEESRQYEAKAVCGDFHTLGISVDGTVQATGLNSFGQCDVADWGNLLEVAGGNYHTVGLKGNGRAVAAGRRDDGRCDVEGWTDLVSVAAGGIHSVGLREDGTVVWTGHYPMNQDAELAKWNDIVAIAEGE